VVLRCERQRKPPRAAGRGAQAHADFSGLAGLIEAAPLPMWFRDAAMRLRLVNTAYVRAVGAASAAEVVDRGIELVEPMEGLSAAQVAADVFAQRRPPSAWSRPRSTASAAPCA
jgi:PAS domain-containing protein